jgi:hypothetical protein
METGVTYSLDPTSGVITAINLSGLVHQFYCESELMVEDYQPGSGGKGYQGKSTSFRTHVQLLDPNKNPRANKSVKVWASDPVTITAGGKSYDIDAASTGKSAWLQTDGSVHRQNDRGGGGGSHRGAQDDHQRHQVGHPVAELPLRMGRHSGH